MFENEVCEMAAICLGLNVFITRLKHQSTKEAN